MIDLQREKEQLAKKVQIEEENLHLNLKRRLKELQQEKVDTENMLEIEQEQIVNKLSKELADAITEKKYCSYILSNFDQFAIKKAGY